MDEQSRRRLLVGAGATLAAALAGCADPGSSDGTDSDGGGGGYRNDLTNRGYGRR